MDRSLHWLRHLLLLALVGWGVVDDLFPSTPNPLDPVAECGAYLPAANASLHNARPTKSVSLSTRSRLVERPAGSLVLADLWLDGTPFCALTGRDRLFALMSLQR